MRGTKVGTRFLYVLALVVLVTAVAGLRALSSARAAALTAGPRITSLGRFEVTIVWETKKPIRGEVVYRTGSERERIRRESGDARRHVLKLTGLMPETVYRYRLGRRAKISYEFRTAPLTETAFRFMVYDRDYAFARGNEEPFLRSIRSELPDFVILSGRLTSKSGDYQAEEERFFNKIGEASRLPIFLLPGGGDLRNEAARERFSTTRPGPGRGYDYTFDYGNSRFVVLGPGTGGEVKSRLAWLDRVAAKDRPAHVFVLLAQPGAAKGGLLAAKLLALTRAGKVEVIIGSGPSGGEGTLPGPQLLRLDGKRLVVDVDGEGVTGMISRHDGSGPQVLTIKESPEAVKRSCIYCRKLLDTRRYQESIKWYRDFISTFGERYMVDDARYEIANIYDQYLYDYPNAVREYETLVSKYPNGNRYFQAVQRLEYLRTYSDYGFKPLRVYEKAKNQGFQRDRQKAVRQIEGILLQYPGARIEPQVLLWLGYTLTQEDLAKASSYYRQVIVNYPALAAEAWIALGDACYQHRKYRPAIAAYLEAQAKSDGSLNLGLLDKLRKSGRNIVRDYVLLAAVVLLTGCLLLALWLKPRLLLVKEIKFAGYLCLLYLVTGSLIWAAFFRGYPELPRWLWALSPAGALGASIGSVFSRKVFSRLGGSWRLPCTMLTTVFLTGAICYILLYIYHYLPAFGV